MNTKQIIEELRKAGNATTKKIYLSHGATEPFFGTKIEDMKKIMKKVTDQRQEKAMELYDSGIGDAQYMAALMADGGKMSKKELQGWADRATWQMISEYSVPWVTSENENGWELALKWIDSGKPKIACSGWTSLSSIMATWPDERLDIATIRKLLTRVEKEINDAPNRVRYCMNGFVIAAGCYIKSLTKEATATGKRIGSVEVDMNGTSCKVPFAPDYIKKVIDKGYLGRKKKTAKC